MPDNKRPGFELQQTHGNLPYQDVYKRQNPYYDLMGNEYICWRVILYLFAKRYLNLVGQIRGCTVQTRALIFDDSPLGKRGKKIEGVSKVYDHVTGNFIFGYKILVCGY